MRTTISISETIIERSKKHAQRVGKTLSELIELALMHELDLHKKQIHKKFKLVTSKGDGLQPGMRWESLAAQIEENDDVVC